MTFINILLFKYLGIIPVIVGNYRTHPEYIPTSTPCSTCKAGSPRRPRRQLIAQVEPLLVRGDCVEIKTGLEFWFTPPTPTQRHPPPYKQFLLTLSAIFPLSVLVPWALRPLLQVVPVLGLPVVRSAVVASVIVGLMTYVIMPHYTRLVANWLYR